MFEVLSTSIQNRRVDGLCSVSRRRLSVRYIGSGRSRLGRWHVCRLVRWIASSRRSLVGMVEEEERQKERRIMNSFLVICSEQLRIKKEAAPKNGLTCIHTLTGNKTSSGAAIRCDDVYSRLLDGGFHIYLSYPPASRAVLISIHLLDGHLHVDVDSLWSITRQSRTIPDNKN